MDGQLSIQTPQSFRGKSKPSSRSSSTVIHQKFALFEADLCMMIGDALIGQFYMGVLCFSYSNCVVIFEDGSVGRFIIGFLELEFDHSLIDVLNPIMCTFFRIRTRNSTSQESCTNCSSLRTRGFLSLMYRKVPVLLPKSLMQQASSRKTICACFPLMDNQSG